MNPVRLTVLLTALVTGAAIHDASAQSWSRGVEIGAQAAVLRLSDFGATSAGVGGRASVDLSKWMAIEGEASFYPHADLTVSQSAVPEGPRVVYHRRRGDAFFGAKVGYRGDRFGAFAKVRPGFARLTDRGVECLGQVCALMLLVRPDYHPEFALDYGGILEIYPSTRTVARFDLGDVLIRHRSFAPPCSDCSSHNFTSRVGIGFRF